MLLLLFCVFALHKLHTDITLVAGHRHQCKTYDATDRIFRWCIVVAAVWSVVFLAFEALPFIDFAQAFNVQAQETK